MRQAAGGSVCPVPKCKTDRRPSAPEAREAPPGRLCGACRDDLAAGLAELPRLHREIEHVVGPVITGRGERVSGSRNYGFVFDEEASAVGATMTSVLASWAGVVTGLLAVRAPERAVGPLAVFLLRHVEVLAGHPAVAELAEEVGGLVAQARRIVHWPERRLITLGPCPRSGCGSVVEASVGDVGGEPSGAVRCRAGHVWPVQEWLALRRGVAGNRTVEARPPRRTLPTRLAAQAAGVSEATVRKWASRGKLTRYGSASRAEYDVNELAALAAG